MATKYNVEILVNNEWTPVALFSDNVPEIAMKRFANTMFDEIDDCENVLITDMEAQSVIWEYYDDEIEEEYEGDIDEADLEMGFNPYLGGYDYDC